HDAARPFMPFEVVARVIKTLESQDGACAALPVFDALWMERRGMADHSVSREGLWRAQTPQGFRFDAILAAHRATDGEEADDVAVARKAGIDVQLVQGAEIGFKITTQDDLARALRLTALD
ncbi:MAG: 2-C-methyl-D-erythritol 4-phosphate cytidylyltransferase, partial [Pseudomonadota bacterium]